MSNSDYWFELGYKSGTKEIESLRQQLSAAQAELEAERNRRFEGNRISSQEYNDSQKREVILRIAVEYCVAQVPEFGTVLGIEEALAATDDLKDVRLCHAEPCRDDGRCQYAIDHGAEGLGHCPEGKCCMPLYRAAKEQGK
ncbi:MAG: hypothetical protein IPG22_06290 [Acidobacteria bacterium]|nr:hypothetical protein [Acidobacteriota bacterium]